MGVDLGIRVATMGPNGAGRAVLLKLMTGNFGAMNSSPIAREC